jgi:translocation and assembly module TamB
MPHTETDTPNTQAPTPQAPRRQPFYKRAAAWLGTLSAVSLSALLGPLVLVGLVGALWAWTGTANSLATALKIAGWSLPPAQQLRSTDIRGSLRQGGQIGQLQWQNADMQVTAQNAQIELDWSQLWLKAWPVRSIQLKALHVQDQRPAQDPTPWTALRLPLPVQLQWQVDQFTWQGTSHVAASNIQAHYAFDGLAHQLDVHSLNLAQGSYRLQARLQGDAPMALQLDLQGQVQTPASDGIAGLPLVLQSSLAGHLSGPKAELKLKAQLTPATDQGRSQRPQDKVHLDLQAHLAPWAAQPLLQAQAQWQALNLAPFWPDAPQTLLQGQARVTPDGQAWRLAAELSNATPGPWDTQRLPVAELSLRARYNEGLWQVQQAQAQMAGGHVQAQAQQTTQGWTGQVDLQDLLPAQLHSALPAPAVTGRLEATTQIPVQGQAATTSASAVQSIRLLADLSAKALPDHTQPSTPSANPLADLAWEKLHLSGQWSDQTWDIDALRLQAAQALLEGQFKLQPALRSVQGHASLTLPGLQAHAQGSLAPLSGLGTWRVAVQDASKSLSWLQALAPWAPPLQGLSALRATGTGLLEAQWQGGYEQADTPLSLTVQWPRLEWLTPSAQTQPSTQAAWVLAQGRLHVQGTPQAVQAQLQAEVGQGAYGGNFNTSLSARRSGVHNANWQGQIDSVQLSTLAPKASAPTDAWRLQLQQALAWQAHISAPVPTFSWGPSQWQITGPSPGTGHVHMDAGAWTAAGAGRPGKTQGAAQWQGVPLNWARPWLGTDIQNDVLLKGQLQWQLDKDLRLNLSAERSQGDLYLNMGQTSGPPTAAGLRRARVLLNILNHDMRAEFDWDSQNLGQVQAQVQSQLSLTAQGQWQWHDQSPLRGSVQARLPQVGAWSVLAPPGWRVQGTLDARLALTGTRGLPQWEGQLTADQLAVRSAVQGIEFSQGQMQARLQGQSLILDRLSLSGAGAQGGQLLAQGRIDFNPMGPRIPSQVTAPNRPLSAAVMALNLQAKGLRVSNRADRRLTLSGDVTAHMAQGQLQLRGGLKADQALFILPDDSTPQLGDDVVVLTPGVGNFNLTDPRTATNGQSAELSWLGVPDVQVQLDLGSDFKLEGKGLTTQLVGQLVLVSNAKTEGLPQLSGQVRTRGGRYKAYGQQLNIETGVLRFDGPYDNPSLDIIALRPNLPHKVGVQITGTALLPRIRLYAEPDLPDADKLAWLVLGRPAAGGGTESAVLQQAAMVLLSGDGPSFSSELANRLGLDEISLATGSRSDANATGAAVTLGKRLSKDFYLAYETSLSGAFGSLYIFYDLSRRLTLRAQAGDQSALDLIFTIRHD